MKQQYFAVSSLIYIYFFFDVCLGDLLSLKISEGGGGKDGGDMTVVAAEPLRSWEGCGRVKSWIAKQHIGERCWGVCKRLSIAAYIEYVLVKTKMKRVW